MRITIGDDSVLFRTGLGHLLGDLGHEVVHAAADAVELRSATERLDPDLAIIDIRMPPGPSAGAETAVALRNDAQRCGILLLSQHIELRHCRELIGTGGFGYLLKDRVLDLAEFGDALDRIAAGGTALDSEVVRALVHDSAPTALDRLTAREREILSYAAQGRSNAAIAGSLVLSERTVEAHMRSVFAKLGLADDLDTNRRVLAVVALLEHRTGAADPTR